MNAESIFKELIKNTIGDEVESITKLPQSGSSRNYFRIKCSQNSYIGTQSDNTEENTSFLYLAEHFGKNNLPVPQTIAVSADKKHYIQSDFGDLTLYKIIQDSIKKGTDESITNLLKQALRHLVEFQIKGHENLDYSKTYPVPSFDKESVINDLNYFKYYFLKLHENVIFNEKRLDDDFDKLADFISQAKSDFFMYRDFQSRNIMIKDGKTYFIDFQGGRKGPLQYDVVSLLYQVKAHLTDETKKEMVEFYKSELSKYIDPKAIKFDYYFPAFVLTRLLQVCGAYGFRGLIQKKSHFIESIPYALESLKKEYKRLPIELTELNSALEQLFDLIGTYSTKKTSKLKVTLNSFSYKNGSYPQDLTGNGGGHVFDCRSLPNPGREEMFKNKNGMDKEVADYILKNESAKEFIIHTHAIVNQSIKNYIERGFNNLSVSFGCTGGQHRSVFFAQEMFEWLKREYPDIELEVNHIAQRITDRHRS